MKKLLLFVTMAASLLFTQCKKEDSVSSAGKTVSMTVTAGPGSKTDITDAGAITWSAGDKLYVGDGSKYIGYLTIASGVGTPTGVFTGNVTLPTDTKDGEKSFGFFYLGSKNYTEGDDALQEGTSTQATVSFASQNIYNNNGKLENASACHVGYGSAMGTVVGNVVTDINVMLVSKVAIARFDFKKGTDAYTGALKLSGDNIYSTMTVKFNSTGFACEGTEGEISLTNTTSSEKYVMLVPTDETTGEQILTFADANVSGSYTLANGIEANKFYGLTGAIEVTLEAAAPAHEYVDLGLPNGLLWATCNLGADSPEEYGDYYAWGETTTKSDYTWSTYKWCNGSYTTLTKYNTMSNYGTVDGKEVLDMDDDAARANWGGDWRMPTSAEWQELASNTYMKWEYNYAATGVSGFIVYKVKDDADRGLMTIDENYEPENPGWGTYDQDWNKAELTGEYSTSDAHLFLPAAGYRDGSGVIDAGSLGLYWSSSLYSFGPDFAYYMRFDSGCVYPQNYDSRFDGFSVRPVQ